MRQWTVPQMLFLGLAGFYFCGANAGAQSSGPYSCCPPNAECQPVSAKSSSEAKNHVDSLALDGPIHLPGATLEQVVTSLKEEAFDRDSGWQEKVEEALRRPWLDQGYFQAKVSVQATPYGGDSGHYAIIAHVEEGLQYRLGRIDFRADSDPDSDDYGTPGKPLPRRASSEGTSDSVEIAARPVFRVEQLRSLIPLQDGDVLNVEKVREGLEALNRLYGNHGYIDFVAAPGTEIDDEDQIVSILINLAEEKQYRIGKIEVYGLDAGSEHTLIWKIKTGDIFDNELLQAFFDDNQSVLPAGASYAKNSKIVRHAKIGTVDVEFRFKSCFGR